MEDPATWERLEAILEEVRGLPPEARTARIEALVPEDEALRAEAIALADASAAAEEGLPVPGGGTVGGWFTGPEHAAEVAGVEIGGFEILREIGQGGMGVVYEARQKEPDRRVALKMLRFGLGSQDARARLDREARILANLDHPAIATLYGVGTYVAPGGAETPYLVMELVDGARPITEFGRESLRTREDRLALFLEAAHAVSAGHQRGIIHRDLKPDNVLVDRAGRLKVIDFGIARVTTPDLLEPNHATRTRAVMGTLGYIAPEQLAAGAAPDDVRMDVYALGVLLYELLVGEAPIDLRGLDLVAAVRAVRLTPPAPPRRRDPTTPEDLSLIVLKALEKDPSRRYRSVDAVIADLEAYRKRQPISARPPSLTYQLGLFARRHRVPVIAGVTIALALGAATWWSMAAARSEEVQRARAEREAGRARGMLLGSQRVIQGVLGEFYPELQGVPGTLGARRALVADVEEGLNAIRLQAVEDIELLRMAAAQQLLLGRLQYSKSRPHLGRPKAAARAYSRARDLYERIARRKGRPPREVFEDTLGWVHSVMGLADVAHADGDLDAALRWLASARTWLEGVNVPEEERQRRRRTLADVDLRHAMVLDSQGHRPQAIRLLSDALRALPALDDGRPGALQTARTRGHVASLLGDLQILEGKSKDARPSLEEARAAFDRFERLGGGDRMAWQQHALLATHLGDLALEDGNATAALGEFRRALELDEKALTLEPADRGLRQAVQVDHAKLAQVHDALGDLDAAIAEQRRAADLARAAVDANPHHLDSQLRLRITLNLLGGMLVRASHVAEGAEVFQQAMDLAQEMMKSQPEHPEVRLGMAEALDGMGIARYFQSGVKGVERAPLLREALAYFEKSKQAHHALAEDGLLPATHAEAEARIDNKIRVMRTELAKVEGGK